MTMLLLLYYLTSVYNIAKLCWCVRYVWYIKLYTLVLLLILLVSVGLNMLMVASDCYCYCCCWFYCCFTRLIGMYCVVYLLHATVAYYMCYSIFICTFEKWIINTLHVYELYIHTKTTAFKVIMQMCL